MRYHPRIPRLQPAGVCQCIEFDEMITGHIHRLFIKDNTLFVESEDYEQTIDPISDYSPYGIGKIHEKILARK